MGKYKALQVCYTTAGKLIPEVRDADNKKVWDGDVAELPDDEAAAFGKKHLEPVAASTKCRRYVDDVVKKPGKTLAGKKGGKGGAKK